VGRSAKLGKGAGLGIAAHRSFLTYVATVVEVEVNDQGEVRIPRVDTVLDAGLIVNPEPPAPSSKARRSSGPASFAAGDHRKKWGHPAVQLQRLPGGSHQRSALPDQCAHRRQQRSSGRRRGTGRAAVRGCLHERHLAATGSGFGNCRFGARSSVGVTAATNGGTPGSPTPAGGALLSTMCTLVLVRALRLMRATG